MRRIALNPLQGAGQCVDVFCNTACGQFARALHACGVQRPQRIEHISLRLQRRARRRVQHKGLSGRLVLAHADQIGLNTQLVQGIFIVIAPAAQAFDRHRAQGVQQHLAGMGGQVILALVVARRPGNHRFARGLEALDGRRRLAQGHQTATLEVV